MQSDQIPFGLTFDDVLLLPAKSEVLPSEVNLETKLTRDITLGIPLVSAAMDTVTEAHTAIAMAQEGGIGIIHKNMTPEQQGSEVDKVKKSESGMIVDPITMDPDRKVIDALELMAKYRISGVPITETGKKEGKLVGILTNRDLRFETKLERPIREVMTSENLVTVRPGIVLEDAKAKLHEHRIEKLLTRLDRPSIILLRLLPRNILLLTARIGLGRFESRHIPTGNLTKFLLPCGYYRNRLCILCTILIRNPIQTRTNTRPIETNLWPLVSVMARIPLKIQPCQFSQPIQLFIIQRRPPSHIPRISTCISRIIRCVNIYPRNNPRKLLIAELHIIMPLANLIHNLTRM